jgi:hypothetical protein
MSENFGPLPAGSIILWQSEHFLMYMDSKGDCWRYMHEFHAKWPVIFDPPLDKKVYMEPKPVTKYGLTDKEIEELI